MRALIQATVWYSVFVLLSVGSTYAGEPQRALTAQEDCDAYYEKAKRYVAEAEAITIEGFGALGLAAKKGGVSGQGGAFANLYQACILRQSQKEKAP